jgi:hypothetical protein
MDAPYQLDHARCPRGHWTPIRHSMPPAIANDQRLKEMGNERIFVACIQCPLVYPFETQNLVSRPSMHGLQPDPVDAPLRLSFVYIPCDEGGCESQIEIRAVRNSDTTDEAIGKECKNWQGTVKCLHGHSQPLPFPWFSGE